jgi:hypothetical protein
MGALYIRDRIMNQEVLKTADLTRCYPSESGGAILSRKKEKIKILGR